MPRDRLTYAKMHSRGSVESVSVRVGAPGARSPQLKPVQPKPMPTRRSRASRSLAAKAVELSQAVPEVVAHRLTRMALAGATLSPRDRKEFARMFAEKNAAFGESWVAMTKQAGLAHQALSASFLKTFFAAARGTTPSLPLATAQLHRAALGVVAKGFAPVHQKAVANARRLRRTKLR